MRVVPHIRQNRERHIVTLGHIRFEVVLIPVEIDFETEPAPRPYPLMETAMSDLQKAWEYDPATRMVI